MAVISAIRSTVVVVSAVVVVSTVDEVVVKTGVVVGGAVAGVSPTVVHPPAMTAATAVMNIAPYRICLQLYVRSTSAQGGGLSRFSHSRPSSTLPVVLEVGTCNEQSRLLPRLCLP